MHRLPSLSFESVASWLSVVFIGLLALALAGCSRPQALSPSGQQLASQVDRADPARQLAYEHAVTIDTTPDRIAAVHAAGLNACRKAKAGGCTLLASSIDSGADGGATMKFRARPDLVPVLVAALGQQAKLVRQSTEVEDLSGPISDTARQLAMLQDYRQRLEDLRSRAGSDVDALIKVNRELADVQSSLEDATGKRAVLTQRIETDILNVAIRSDRHRPFWSPIGRALADFRGDLARGIASAISGLAYLIPWLLMLGVIGWAVRRLWRRRAASREKNAPVTPPM